MIASLMMYRRAELDAATARFWDSIRVELEGVVECPTALAQDAEEFSVWEHPGLVLSQTCGMPYRTRLHKCVGLVGTPDYRLEGCAPGYYRSALVVRESDVRQELDAFLPGIFAFNARLSQSGFAAMAEHLDGRWFAESLETGAHLASARAVAEGRADVAAIDAVTWRLIDQHEGIAAELRVLEWTRPTPGLPLITALLGQEDTLFAAVAAAIQNLSRDDRLALGLHGIVRIPKADYMEVPNPDT